MSRGTVLIECYETGFRGPWDGSAVVAIDVIRATTTAVTSIALGRRCFPAASLEVAVSLAARLSDPLLVGELGGNMPYGFHLTNSPSQVAQRADVGRPMLLLSTSGTALIGEARSGATAVYAACLRNWRAQAEHLVGRHRQIALVGAGSRHEFREEDQMCCAWIADALVASGYEPLGQTAEFIERWRGVPPQAMLVSNSALYLADTHQDADLEFILNHIDDLDLVVRLEQDELVGHAPGYPARVAPVATTWRRQSQPAQVPIA